MRKGEDLNLQDESVWRARTLKASYALRALLTELGAWFAALVIALTARPEMASISSCFGNRGRDVS